MIDDKKPLEFVQSKSFDSVQGKPKIKNRLRHCRVMAGLQQKDLASLMDIDPTQISKWEQGERTPSLYNAIGLSVALGVLVDELFYDCRQEWHKTQMARMTKTRIVADKMRN